MVTLARQADLLLAEATYAGPVPEDSRPYMSSAAGAAARAAEAGAARLLLTHLWPGTDPETALSAAAPHYDGDLAVATPGLTVDL
jgi:ribonuclease BN (tRNA processing enzyme)